MKPTPLVELIEKDIPPLPCWIDPFILPKRGTWLLGGASGIAKSFIMIELARALATGTRPFGCPHMQTTAQCKVLFVEQELGEFGLQKRVKKAFSRHQPSVYRNQIDYISKCPEFRLDTDEGHEEILEAIEISKPNVLILDPISFFHQWDEQDNTGIGDLFRQLELIKKIGIEQDLSIIISHHFRKPPTGKEKSGYDPLDFQNFRGASKWGDAPDTIMTAARHGTSMDWWFCKVSWQKTRHGERLPDMMLKVTPDEEAKQVEFEHILGPPPPLKLNLAPPPQKV